MLICILQHTIFHEVFFLKVESGTLYFYLIDLVTNYSCMYICDLHFEVYFIYLN